MALTLQLKKPTLQRDAMICHVRPCAASDSVPGPVHRREVLRQWGKDGFKELENLKRS